MTSVSSQASATRYQADNAIAKRALDAVHEIDREAQKRKHAQLDALESAQQAIRARMEEFQHQLVQLNEALAAIRPGARQHIVQHSGGRRDHDSLRQQIKEWLQQRKEQRFAARDIVQVFPALEGAQLSVMLKPLVDDGTISRDFSQGAKRPRYYVRDSTLL